jgi:hypothetical protein
VLETEVPGDQFDGELAKGYVGSLAALGPRPAGSAAHAAAIDFVVSELTRYGWRVQQQAFEHEGVALRNLIAMQGPEAALDAGGAGAIILAAPLDTRPVAEREEDPSLRERPVLGANDGASGVAILLELARSLNTVEIGTPVWLVFLDGQALGEARAWANGPGMQALLPTLAGQPQALVMLNVVGSADQNLAYEANSDAALREALWQIAAELDYGQWFPPEVRHTVTDTAVLTEAGVPVVNIIDLDYPYWGTLQDTADKVSAESLARVGRVLEAWLEEGHGATTN